MNAPRPIPNRTRRIIIWSLLYLIVAHVAGAWGLWQTLQTTDELHEVMGAEQAEENIEEAIRCVDSWNVRDKISDSDEAVLRVSAEALISVANADPEIVAQYRALTEGNVERIRDLIPEPECDRASALTLLGGS